MLRASCDIRINIGVNQNHMPCYNNEIKGEIQTNSDTADGATPLGETQFV